VRNQTSTNPSVVGGAIISPPPETIAQPQLSACCGNGVLDQPPEQCDDGNTLHCDLCSPSCTSVPIDLCQSDGDPCTGPGCNPRTGCVAATGPACAGDGDPCTDDICLSGE
jgi:cysteine-rich repeat protein